MELTAEGRVAVERIVRLSQKAGIDIKGGRVRRTSSRFCLGVEHGDYNGTELFGVGTDRFIWLAYRPNGTDRIKLFSGNFPEDGVVEFKLGDVPEPKSTSIAETWGRFAYGVEYILRREGLRLTQGIDGIVYGGMPGGGMSRSASLSLNLILSLLDANNINLEDRFKIVDMAQAVENDYIGSPCGQLDQIMILFARKGTGTYYNPKTRSVKYVSLGAGATDFRIVVLDTGTVRPGLEKSTYKIRRAECEKLVSLLQKAKYDISAGDIETVGRIFREDGIGLRDDYKISGPELETMCDIARSVPGVLGERMLGGGDKGAAGVLVKAESVDALKSAVDATYPRKRPEYKNKYAVHICNVVDGVRVYDDLLG
jgi:galactokinase